MAASAIDRNIAVAAKDYEDSILYDLMVFTSWTPEPEPLGVVIAQKPKGSLVGKVTLVALRSLWTFLRSTGIPLRSSTTCSLPSPLIKLINAQVKWHMATASNGQLVAILQDTCIEIRSNRDEYETLVGKCNVQKDPYPQWRQLAWSPDCTMLAYADSSGNVTVFDLVGSLLFTIDKGKPRIPDTPVDLSCAVSALIFTDYKQTAQWSAELLIMTFQGSLHSYLVSPTEGYRDNHSFLFGSQHPQGVSCAIFHPGHSLLLIGGCLQQQPFDDDPDKFVTMATQQGITVWRVLSTEPYYKLVTDYAAEIGPVSSSRKFLRKVSSVHLFRRSKKLDGVYKMCLSPDGSKLVTVHQSGLLSIWDVPSFKRKHAWPLQNQPEHDEINPNILVPMSRKRVPEGQVAPQLLSDVNFWSDKALILARCSGALTVSSTESLANLLGGSCEWFEPSPRVSQASDKGFLALECESKLTALKRQRTHSEHDIDGQGTNEESEDEDAEDATLLTKTSKYTKQVLYFLTEAERFQPPRKKPKMISHVYRLVGLQKTTPEELYARRIENEEYGEALALAQRFGLDSDMVYQRQWRKATVSLASIQDYLSKITKRAWVLHECLERVPDDIDAARELLQYGLRGTDLEALIAIGKGEDHGRFILSSEFEPDESFDAFDADAEERVREMEKEHKKGLLKQVDFKMLTLEQKELCRYRAKLLTYLDRLSTYEEILGGGEAASRFYIDTFFKNFRCQNIVEAALDFARDSDWKALEIMFTHHGKDLLPHWLMILNNFPETTSPAEYKTLLPEAGDGPQHPEVFEWDGLVKRDSDWCEGPACQAVINPTPVDYGTFLYEDHPELREFCAEKLTHKQLQSWYSWRARDIERQSKLVDHALELVEIARENNVKGLDELYDDILALDSIAYECQTEVSISLDVLQEMDELSKLQLMMIKSSSEMYVKNVKHWVIPFLERCEKRVPGSKRDLLSKYMLAMAKNDLANCVLLFENSKSGVANPIVSEPKELMKLGLDCVYACKREDQLDLAFKIMNCMPKKGFGIMSEDITSLHDLSDKLFDHLRASEILGGHALPKPPVFIRDTQDDIEESKKIMIRLTRQAARKKPSLSEYEWKQLLSDMLELQRKVYTCLTPQECYEIYVESLLGSSSTLNIHLAGELLTRTNTEEQLLDKDTRRKGDVNAEATTRIGYEKSIELVLSSAREYFNSSSDLMDSCMDLARSCLQLITDRQAGIQEELDLIASLALLDDFNATILPLQVRLCENRLELIQKVLTSSPNTYKQSHKLLQLAKLLRVAGNNESQRKGSVLVLVAQSAMQDKDYHTANKLWRDIIQGNYGAGWEVCQKLADEEHFQDIPARRQLIAFAAGYCDADSLEDVFKTRNTLETQIICNHIGMPVETKSNEEAEDSVEEPTQAQGEKTVLESALLMTTATTKHVLASTGTTTKAVLSAVGDKRWWKDTLKWVRPLSHGAEKTTDHACRNHENSSMNQHGCHPFYETVIKDPYVSQGEMNYCRFQVPSSTNSPVHLSQMLLRVGKLAESKSEGNDEMQSATQVLLQLALEVLPSDHSLGLSYLLALPNPLDAEQCFQKLPHTGLVLQTAAYYYAIQLHTILLPSHEPGTSEYSYYHDSPVNLIDKVINYVTNADGSDWSLEVTELVSQLQHYMTLVVDFDQAQALQKLGTGVDVQRFTKDSEYKHETILGLAMTLEEQVYDLSIALAKRYDLPLWDVYMSHLDFLFSESGLPTPEIEERVNKLGIRATLVSNPAKFQERLNMDVYPTIEGSDHSRLIYYYTLMQFCGSEVKGHTVKPDVHIRALKKLKSAAPGLDYKRFADGDSNPVDVIAPVLKESNVNVIAKLAAKIPIKDGASLSPSQVYAAYLRKLFWEGDRNFKKAPETVADWLHRYEGCGEFFSKLTPADFVTFVADVVFSTKSLEKLELECRQNVITRAQKSARQQGGGKPKFVVEKRTTFTADDAVTKLLQFQKHLQSLLTDGADIFKEYDKEHGTQYLQKYDLTQGEPEKLKSWMMELLCCGVELKLVEESLALCQLKKWSVVVAVKETLSAIIHNLINEGNGNSMLNDVGEPLELLKAVISTISKHEQQGGNLVSSRDVLEVLTPFCCDTTVSAKPRIDVLHMLEETCKLDSDDAQMLLYYRTEAIISSHWLIQVSENNISTDEGRHQLFTMLLERSESWEQLMALSSLLQQWPVLEANNNSDATPEEQPYVQLLLAMARHQDMHEKTQVVVNLVECLQATTPLSTQCVQLLHQELINGRHTLCAMKIVLITQQSSLYQTIIDFMTQIEQLDSSYYDDQLLQLLLECDLTVHLVATPIYGPLAQHLLNGDGDQRSKVNSIADQLQAAGFKAEAGSLLLRHRGTHPMLNTLDSALSALSYWLKK